MWSVTSCLIINIRWSVSTLKSTVYYERVAVYTFTTSFVFSHLYATKLNLFLCCWSGFLPEAGWTADRCVCVCSLCVHAFMGVTVIFMHWSHTHHHTLAVAVVWEVCSSHLVWSSQRGQRITMDFSHLHTYTPPQCTPDNTGYTYSLRWDHCENEEAIAGWNYSTLPKCILSIYSASHF